MLRKNITIPLALPRAIVYYVPLCPRPTVIVTSQMLEKLDKVQVEGPLIEVKQKLTQDLMNKFGKPLIASSSHISPGNTCRSLLCSTPISILFLMTFDPLGAAIYFLLHNFMYHLGMYLAFDDDISLELRYKALCGE